MDENGCFLKALPTKRLSKKGKKTKYENRSRQLMTVAFFVSANDDKVDKSIII